MFFSHGPFGSSWKIFILVEDADVTVEIRDTTVIRVGVDDLNRYSGQILCPHTRSKGVT